MSLTAVKMTEEVWLTCVAHSLSTEKEEIMGVLLGDVQKSSGGNMEALIWGALPQMRSERRKDRVETNPELLTAAAEYADHIMSKAIGRTTRVIGWYHSHPHITVLPSWVDVRTQATYQLLEQGFVGLIFSCFNEDAQKAGRIQVIAFQSLDRKQQQQMQLQQQNRQYNLQQQQQREAAAAIEVPSSSSSSQSSALQRSSADYMITESAERDSADSSRSIKPTKVSAGSGSGYSSMDFYMHSDNPILTTTNSIYNNEINNASPIAEMSDEDMNASMQEALHRSNMEASAAEYVRKEVPLQVLPASYLLNLESPMASFMKLQHVLYDEERSAYKQALQNNLNDGKMHPLTYVHHSSTYHASLCKLMEICLSPAINVLQDRLKQNEIRMEMLKEEAKTLEAEAKSKALNTTKSESPRRAPPQNHHKIISSRAAASNSPKKPS